MSQQLCLFKFERPLLDRFGAEFFRAVPHKPGVYVFVGARGRVLYVGQSKDLRVRLSYYKNARPEREPRKIIRMVHQTRGIRIERCDSAEDAQLREVELIQTKRPRFNAALTSSPSYSFFGVRHEANQLILRLTLRSEPHPHESFHGAFKNRGLCRRAFFAIGRALWADTHKPASAYDFPLWLRDHSKAQEWRIGATAETVEPFLSGEGVEFLERIESLVRAAADPFLKKVFECDALTLAEFSLLAQRMRDLRRFAGNDRLLAQKEVDSIQLRYRSAASARQTALDAD